MSRRRDDVAVMMGSSVLDSVRAGILTALAHMGTVFLRFFAVSIRHIDV
jgi:hypothetical protein